MNVSATNRKKCFRETDVNEMPNLSRVAAVGKKWSAAGMGLGGGGSLPHSHTSPKNPFSVKKKATEPLHSASKFSFNVLTK
jgi:hypothetical protein